MTEQMFLEHVGGRTAPGSGRLVPGEYLTASPMRGAPSVRLMVLAVSGPILDAAPHGGGTAVTVCTRSRCEGSPTAASACARTSGAWHPIAAPVADGLF